MHPLLNTIESYIVVSVCRYSVNGINSYGVNTCFESNRETAFVSPKTVQIHSMGRKPTTCPDSLERPIRQSKAFPIDFSESDLRDFEMAFSNLVFSPGGYHFRFREAVRDSGPSGDLFLIKKPFVEDLQSEIKTCRAIPKEFIDLAIELGIPPGKHSLNPILWRMWGRTKELRAIADLRKDRAGPVFVEHTSVLMLNPNATLSELTGESQTSGIIHLIIREKISVDRIRRCANCNHVFWARNKRAETCSRECNGKQSNKRKKEKNDGNIQTKG